MLKYLPWWKEKKTSKLSLNPCLYLAITQFLFPSYVNLYSHLFLLYPFPHLSIIFILAPINPLRLFSSRSLITSLSHSMNSFSVFILLASLWHLAKLICPSLKCSLLPSDFFLSTKTRDLIDIFFKVNEWLHFYWYGLFFSAFLTSL